MKEGDKRSDMGKGGGPNPEQKGGLGPLCLTLGTGPSSPFLEVCHVIVNYLRNGQYLASVHPIRDARG